MRWSIAVPQYGGPQGVDLVGLQRFLRRAEELDFEGVWVMEQSLGPTPLLSPLETLAYAAAFTERVRLGVGVIVAGLASPLHLAAGAATVDQLSHGRLELGLVAGGGFRNFGAFGIDRSTYLSRFNEGLALIRNAWSDEPLRAEGRFFAVDGPSIEPKPVQRPHPPLWFGGGATTALARAVREGDGFLGAGSSTTERFAAAVGVVREQLEEQGRDPAGFRIAKRVYLAVDDDRDAARARIEHGLRRVYGDNPDLPAVAVTGTPEDVAAGLREVRDAGAQMILLHTLDDDAADGYAQMERLVAEVIPLVG